MPNDISQQPNTSADKSAAALAFATMLSEQMMPKVQPEEQVLEEGAPTESSQTPETVPGEEVALETEEIPQEEVVEEPKELEPEKENEEIKNLAKGFDEFKGEVKGIIESKFDDLTKTLKDALKE